MKLTKILHICKTKLTNTLMTKDDDDRFHFLQTAEGRCEILRFCSVTGKNEQLAEASHCGVPEISLHIKAAYKGLLD